MLANKVDGEHPANYYDLLLATQKLERLAEARDTLPPKMAATSGLNMMCSQKPGNLFPSHKMKGNCTFAAEAATVRNDEAEEDSSVKLEGEREMEPSVDEDAEASGGLGEMDQTIEYIASFDKVVEWLKNKNCFGCGSPDHLI